MKCLSAQALAVLALLLVGCQSQPITDSPADEEHGELLEKPKGYVALPGRAATSNTPSETDVVFDAAVASLGTSSKKNEELLQDHVSDPDPVNTDPVAIQPGEPAEQREKTPAPRTPADGAGYALQITNGTPGRLFIEAQDDAGNIFPFGFMYANQSLSTQPQDPKPIEGQITIVIRDPDKPGAPEVRRYQVAPPAEYMGKTVGVTILPGRYRAALNGKVYYSSPLPENASPEAAN